jgi:large subunit ribosomal protein L13
MKTVIFNGKNAVLGRLGAQVSKELLKGNSVLVINSEQVVTSGKKEQIVERKQKRRMGAGGSLKGPTYIRQSDRLLKRMIRGMLPWEKTKGREAYKRLKCFVGNGDLSEDELKEVKEIKVSKPQKVVTMKEIVGALK